MSAGQFIDLMGQTFGLLTVVGRMPPARGGVFWICECACGGKTKVRGHQLRFNKIKSCGCYGRADIRAHRVKSLAGQTFGNLTAIDYERVPGRRELLWRCMCSCGNETKVWRGNLLSGNTTSCGCVRDGEKPYLQLDLKGQKFGKLTALYLTPAREGFRQRSWMCACDCGKTKEVITAHLSGGITISCGCAWHLGGNIAFRRKDVRDKSSTHRLNRKNRTIGKVAVKEVDDLFEKQGGRCANCLKPLGEDFHRDHKKPLARGGLNVIANIQLMCRNCNQRKHTKDELEFARSEGRLL